MEKRLIPSRLLILPILVLVALAPGCDSKRRHIETLSVAGSVDLPPTITQGIDLALDPGLEVVYVSGGMGQTGIGRVDVQDPAAMTVTAFAPGFGGGIAVDPVSHRVATTDAFGQMLGVFEPTGATFDAEPISGCGGLATSGGPGRFAASWQCADGVAVYDQATASIVFQTASGGVGGTVFFNAATAIYYQNRTPRSNHGGRDEPLAISPSGAGFAAAGLGIDGRVAATDPVRNRIYFWDEYGVISPAPMVMLDGTTLAQVAPVSVTQAGTMVVAPMDGRAFHNDFNNQVTLLDADTGAAIHALDVGAATGGYSVAARPMVTDGDRLYVVGIRTGVPPRLFVIERRRVRLR